MSDSSFANIPPSPPPLRDDVGPIQPADDSPLSPLGQHMLVDFFGCAADLDDEPGLRCLLERLTERAGLTLLDLASRRFQPQGVTVFAVLAESHASIHTWPERRQAFADLFTCRPGPIPPEVLEELVAGLRPGSWSERVLPRGERS